MLARAKGYNLPELRELTRIVEEHRERCLEA